MLLNNIPVYSGRVFSWRANRYAGSMGSVEVSNLNHPGSAFVGRVWDDACDVGFVVRSHRTGAEKVFIERAIIRDKEGDIKYWVFRAWDGSATIEVFND